MAERKPISKKMRFEVFKRDSFTCQYCGAKAPDVILHVDHLLPVKEGGKNTMLNLITACQSCNSGKSARLLDDNSMVTKQRNQMEELSEKREQMKLMVEWKNELEKYEQEQVELIESFLEDKMNVGLTDSGKQNLKKHIKRYGFNEVYESLEISYNQYFETRKDADKVINYTYRICANREYQKQNPMHSKQMYVRAILKNKNMLHNDIKVRSMLKDCVVDEYTFKMAVEIAKTSRNWTQFLELFNEHFLMDY